MNTLDHGQEEQLAEFLACRERELCALLAAAQLPDASSYGDQHDVLDFKDVAAGHAAADVDEIQVEHAAHELEQVLAARRRLQDHSYGLCLDCGEPIDRRRLQALPATPRCTACQALREYPGFSRR